MPILLKRLRPKSNRANKPGLFPYTSGLCDAERNSALDIRWIYPDALQDRAAS